MTDQDGLNTNIDLVFICFYSPLRYDMIEAFTILMFIRQLFITCLETPPISATCTSTLTRVDVWNEINVCKSVKSKLFPHSIDAIHWTLMYCSKFLLFQKLICFCSWSWWNQTKRMVTDNKNNIDLKLKAKWTNDNASISITTSKRIVVRPRNTHMISNQTLVHW